MDDKSKEKEKDKEEKKDLPPDTVPGLGFKDKVGFLMCLTFHTSKKTK